MEYHALNMMVNNLNQLYTDEAGRKFLRSLCNDLVQYIALFLKNPQSNVASTKVNGVFWNKVTLFSVNIFLTNQNKASQ
jgi:hypothetical protein